ncbi:MAG: hypothetical protein ABJE95_11870 [Byssovorax sp.]
MTRTSRSGGNNGPEIVVVFMIFTTGSIEVTGCGAEASAGASGSGGGTNGSAGTGTAASTTSGGSTGTGGAGGASPQNCAEATDCGNFGVGCVHCAVTASCLGPYQTCHDDPQCKTYAVCASPCAPKDLDCLQICASKFPQGAAEYGMLIRCVLCGDCAALCPHPPETCN